MQETFFTTRDMVKSCKTHLLWLIHPFSFTILLCDEYKEGEKEIAKNVKMMSKFSMIIKFFILSFSWVEDFRNIPRLSTCFWYDDDYERMLCVFFLECFYLSEKLFFSKCWRWFLVFNWKHFRSQFCVFMQTLVSSMGVKPSWRHELSECMDTLFKCVNILLTMF